MNFLNIIVLISLVSSCSFNSPSDATAEKSETKPIETRGLLFKPRTARQLAQSTSLIFARFSTAELSNSELSSILRNSFQCRPRGQNVELRDLCSLDPPISPSAALSKDHSSVWQLQRAPKILVWRQTLEKDASFSLEIQDESGLPLPANVSLQRFSTQAVATVTPVGNLPVNKKLYLIGKMRKNKLSQTMMKEFNIHN